MNDDLVAKPGWLWFAIGAVVFAAATTLLGKVGVGEVNSNVATFIRVVVMFATTAARPSGCKSAEQRSCRFAR